MSEQTPPAPHFRARKKPGPPPTGRRILVPTKMWPSGVSALDERLVAVRARCERLGIEGVPTRSDLVRWAVARLLTTTADDWIPETVLRRKKL